MCGGAFVISEARSQPKMLLETCIPPFWGKAESLIDLELMKYARLYWHFSDPPIFASPPLGFQENTNIPDSLYGFW